MTKKAIFIIIAIGTVFALGLGGVLTNSGSFTPSAPVASEQELNEVGYIKGSANPKVTIVEFSDFLCPACATAETVIDQILKDYPDVALRYRHFPLHEDSYKWGQAAEAAGVQGKFFDMAGKLFQNQTSLTDEKIQGFAKELGLDLNKFNSDQTSSAAKQRIEQDNALAQKLSLAGTPTFFIGGKEVNMSSYDDLRKEVEQALK